MTWPPHWSRTQTIPLSDINDLLVARHHYPTRGTEAHNAVHVDLQAQRLADRTNYKRSLVGMLAPGTAEEADLQAEGQTLLEVPTADSLVILHYRDVAKAGRK